MIDPHKITNFERSDEELLEFWLFTMFVAGKRADVQAHKLGAFIEDIKGLDTLSRLKPLEVDISLRRVGAGKYKLLNRGIQETLDGLREDTNFLRRASVDKLSAIYGVGPKSSRFFALHSRRDQKVAVLDTHILSYLRAQGVKAPKSTPSSLRVYNDLEGKFLGLVEKSGLSVAEFDLQIWKDRTLSKEAGQNRGN